MIKKALIILVLFVGLIVIFLLLRPVPVDAESGASVEGIVHTVVENEFLDIVLTLKNDGGSYYINRGLEKQFKPGELGDALNGEHVTILYADQWGHSSRAAAAKHVLQLSASGRELYTELDTLR